MTTRMFRVLIVEDDLALQPFWTLIVKWCFDRVIMDWAVSSEHALQMVATLNRSGFGYDLIVVDLFLAGSDTGYEFLQSEEVAKMNSKTVLVSMAPRGELESKFRNTLPEAVIMSKPLNVVRCERAIREVM